MKYEKALSRTTRLSTDSWP